MIGFRLSVRFFATVEVPLTLGLAGHLPSERVSRLHIFCAVAAVIPLCRDGEPFKNLVSRCRYRKTCVTALAGGSA